jgi:hypothetical protein
LTHHEEILGCFLPAIQESTSRKEVDINFALRGGRSNLALENMLTHTQSLRSQSLICPAGEDTDAEEGVDSEEDIYAKEGINAEEDKAVSTAWSAHTGIFAGCNGSRP